MIDYLKELKHLINGASHKNFSPVVSIPFLELGYKCSITMLYTFEKLEKGFFNKSKDSMIKKNFKIFTKYTRGSLRDLMFLLSLDVAGRSKYIVNIGILVHDVISFKCTDELYMDVDNYLLQSFNNAHNYF
mgnify:FL=1